MAVAQGPGDPGVGRPGYGSREWRGGAHRRSPGRSALPAGTHREAPRRVHLDHAAQQALAVGRDEVRHVKHAPLHLLQQLPQVVVVEGQRPLPAGHGVTAGRAAGAAPRTEQGAGRPGRGGAAGGGARLTTNSAKRITPQLHTSALRPSYFSPCGRQSGWRAASGWQAARGPASPGPGGRARARDPRGCEGRGPSDRQGRVGRGGCASYPDHLGAGIVGGSESKGRSQAPGSGRTPPRPGPLAAPRVTTVETAPGMDAPCEDVQPLSTSSSCTSWGSTEAWGRRGSAMLKAACLPILVRKMDSRSREAHGACPRFQPGALPSPQQEAGMPASLLRRAFQGLARAEGVPVRRATCHPALRGTQEPDPGTETPGWAARHQDSTPARAGASRGRASGAAQSGPCSGWEGAPAHPQLVSSRLSPTCSEAMPKSAIRMLFFSSSSRFSGFRSLWLGRKLG